MSRVKFEPNWAAERAPRLAETQTLDPVVRASRGAETQAAGSVRGVGFGGALHAGLWANVGRLNLRLGRLRFGFGCGLAFALFSSACGAVYPRVQTPIRQAPLDKELNPPPPEDLLAIGFKSVEIPRRTRGGRAWDELGKGAPDPYAKVLFGDVELFRTETQADTYVATWPLTPVRNYRVPLHVPMRVEIWNDNAINAQPICIRTIDDVREEAGELGELSLECEGGGRIEMVVTTARPKFGLGFEYDLRSQGSTITSVLEKSPAEREGLRPGDELVELMGKPVRGMRPEEIRSTVNAHARQGLDLKLRTPGQNVREVHLEEGPIYSLALD